MTVALCIHCFGPADIADDGHRPVCRDCVQRLARVAADPASAHPDVLARLQGRSLDVVHLDTAIVIDPSDPWMPPTVTPRWHWTSAWATDDRLINGKRALP